LPEIDSIKSVYIASIQYPEKSFTKVLIGLDVAGDLDESINKVGEAADKAQIPLQLIEFADVNNGPCEIPYPIKYRDIVSCIDDAFDEKFNLMDRMNATELAANQFRMTQTRDKLTREHIRDPQHAIRTHEQVGKEVRDTILRIGGDLPE
jgi:hypothetical protein